MKKKVLQKVNQAGSMMIEALAMLALVSLVTPTLYKKAAERTMELQDINSATQIRALIKAADSYTSANFANLVEELGGGEEPSGQSKVISSDNLRAYLPEGYQLDSIKNFGAPKAAVKIGGTKGHETLTSYVVLPQQGTLNSVRSARIASMVGANGGIVDKDGDKNVLDGVGNIWKLDKENYANVFGSDNAIQQYSVGAISEHAINVGNSNSLENPKYLQRTLDPGEEWRNTMETTLYMGGPENMDGVGVEYQNIEGVNRLIIGDSSWQGANQDNNIAGNGEALIIANHGSQKGSAWIEDSLTALGDKFKVTGSEDSPQLIFTTSSGKEAGKEDLIINNSGALLNVATKVDNTFETTGKTTLASTGEKTGIIVQPEVAADGANPAQDSSTNIYTKTTTVYGEEPQAKQTAQIADDERNIIFDVQGSAYVNKALEVGDDKDGSTNLYSKANEPILLQEGDRELNVVGDAFVSDTLEAGFVAAHDFDAMNIHAGGKDYTDNIDENNINMGKYNRWLNATENGVFVEDLGSTQNGRDLRMEISNNWVDGEGGEHGGVTRLYGPKVTSLDENNQPQTQKGAKLELKGRQADILTNPQNSNSGRLQLSETEAQLAAYNNVKIYTSDVSTNSQVEIQNGAIVAAGQAGQGNLDNTINMNAHAVTIKGSTAGQTGDPYNTVEIDAANIKVNPGTYTQSEGKVSRSESYMISDADTFTVQKTDPANGNSQKFLNVVSNENSTELGDDSVVGIDPKTFGVWSQATKGENDNNYILQVDATDGKALESGIHKPESSVYIRRGAIELEAHSGEGERKYGADEGLGYIEASRFVANNVDANGNILKPVYVNNNSSDTYDRYMLNPAYTSVMHDIKLTTRGGARLSDILPDFITKGIYLVTNTYKEGSTPTDLRSIDDSSQFASPYLGYVPAPTCPEGYARVITLTPASFQMAQTGTLTRDNRGRFYVSESNPVQRGGSLYNIINRNLLEPGNSITGAKLEQKYVMTAQDVPAQNMWYLGYDNGPEDTGPTYGKGESAVQYAPTPLYFQQSTWLKAATPSYAGKTACAQANTSCNADRWMTIIGFLYPKGSYGALADALLGSGNEGADVDDSAAENANEFYWNLFPVMPDTIEAYATVYCYFDRMGIFGTDADSRYVKKYNLQPSDDYGNLEYIDNDSYKKRLNDPHLKYEDPL